MKKLILFRTSHYFQINWSSKGREKFSTFRLPSALADTEAGQDTCGCIPPKEMPYNYS